MQYNPLGSTGINVSTMALGCWAFAGGDMWGVQDDADSIATVHAALDEGVNFFDTAPGYGNGYSETVLGKALAGRRDKAIIATKVSGRDMSADDVQKACEKSLRLLQTDYIDLYQIHWPSRTTPFSETVAALEKLRDQGKIRAIGVCNFGVQDMNDLLSLTNPVTNQLPYNLIWRAIEYEILPQCVEEGIGILAYSVLAQALLAGKYATPDDVPAPRARSRHFSKNREMVRHDEDGCEAETFAAIDAVRQISLKINESMANVAMAWLLHQPGMTSIIAGARTPDQIKRNVAAVDLKLSPDIIAELNKATDALKQILGTNPDMWQSTSRYR